MTLQNRHSSHATILIVEQDPLLLTAISAMLDMQGYQALLARTEAVAQQAIAVQPIDLIILSIDQLQEGCDFAERLRANDKTRDVPIVFLAPELSRAWTEKLHVHGGIFSILKPVDPHALSELAEKALWMPHLAQRKIQPPAAHLNKATDWVRLE